MDRQIGILLSVYRDTGGVDFHGVRTYTPERAGETVIVVKDRNYGSWRALVLRFTGAPDFLIAGLNFNDARTPSDVEEPQLNRKRLNARSRLS